MDESAIVRPRAFGKSLIEFMAGVGRHFYILAPGVVLGGLDVFERTGGSVVDMPPWLAWVVLGVCVFIAAAWSYHDLRTQSFGKAFEAVRRLKDEMHNIKRRLDELESGGLETALDPSYRAMYRSLPTEDWNNYGALSRPALSEAGYAIVRDAFMDVDRFNRSVIYYPVGPMTDLDLSDISALRRTLDHAAEVLP